MNQPDWFQAEMFAQSRFIIRFNEHGAQSRFFFGRAKRSGVGLVKRVKAVCVVIPIME